MVNTGACLAFLLVLCAAGTSAKQRCACRSVHNQLVVVETALNLVASELQQCPETETPATFEVVNCKGLAHTDTNNILDATGPGSWPAAGVCRVVYPATAPVLNRYEVTISLYSDDRRAGSSVSHPGVTFNGVDKDNYDFVYFRPHYGTRNGCLQFGYVENDQFHGTVQSTCLDSPVVDQVWFDAKVVSENDGQATVYVNDVLVTTVSVHFPSRSGVGVMAANGYSTVVHYKNISVAPLAS